MATRKTVRINMELLDAFLKARHITPKEFCENQLGFSDGWYYGIRKNGGRGVKVLSAQLIAKRTGIDLDKLVIPDIDPIYHVSDENVENDAVESSANNETSVADMFRELSKMFEKLAERFDDRKE